ncbi:pseudoazurin [Methylobacterium organophilum]|uniref:Pseudoazurin n=1 Tax=Methylobacterium organophilum TaxID=410 RepID=A0ABQ4TCH2_METOR|nr:pseudoazurin [Methylobacterium organophilum]GJE28086.1 Pseudoazurin [Methylobacterium organophilum]
MSLSRAFAAAALVVAGSVGAASAAEIVVKTLNSGPGGSMVFDPSFVKIAPGDSIKFVPQDKGHNVESIKGMAPEGADYVKTTVGQEAVVTFPKEGIYGFKCSPHYLMGMVALVQVGDKHENLEQAKAVQHGKLAQKRFDPLFEKVQ